MLSFGHRIGQVATYGNLMSGYICPRSARRGVSQSECSDYLAVYQSIKFRVHFINIRLICVFFHLISGKTGKIATQY